MKGTLQNPIATPDGATIDFLKQEFAFKSQTLRVWYQLLDANGNVISGVKEVTFLPAAAAAFATWFKANAPGPMGNALGTPVTSIQ